jgi:hypothetical protein
MRHDSTTTLVTGESLGLLIEEQRVNNYHTWNSTTDSSSTINPAYIDTQIVSSVLTPRGLPATAYTATKTGNTNQYHGLAGGATSFSISSNTSISASAYIKDFNNTDYRLLFVISAYNVSTNNNRYILYRAIPLTGEWIGGFVDSRWTVTSNVKDVGNGWYRFEISGTNTYEAGWDMINFSFQLLNESNQQFYDPPTANTHGIYLSSPQYELGSFPTSYIPTSGSTVTRAADNASITGKNFSEWYRQDEGTFFVDAAEPSAFVAFQAYLSLQGASTTDEIRIWRLNLTTATFNHVLNSATQGSINPVINTIANKIAHSYSLAQGIVGSANGGSNVQATLSSTTPVTSLRIGARGNNTFYGNRTYKRIAYYPKRLPNAQLTGTNR